MGGSTSAMCFINLFCDIDTKIVYYTIVSADIAIRDNHTVKKVVFIIAITFCFNFIKRQQSTPGLAELKNLFHNNNGYLDIFYEIE
jgi:hypothetical protein